VNRELAFKIADAVLYEGYMLYPYRPSALKNQQRWSFGILYPPDYEEVRTGTERSYMHSECLLRAQAGCRISLNFRFLHLLRKQAVSPNPTLNDADESGGEGVTRSVEFVPALYKEKPQRFDFSFPESCVTHGNATNTQLRIEGMLEFTTEAIAPGLLKVSIEVRNQTETAGTGRGFALAHALVSAHLILAVEGGEFVSLLDPPEELQSQASACKNVGNFPVLVGTGGEHDMMLCSPIILYDYPQIAPESAGDFYDATEMDEMLTLRVMTLTEEEKQQMRSADEPIRELLERTERTAREQLMKTHGTIRSLRPVSESPGQQPNSSMEER
jgi:hypothetical protein